MKKYSLTGTKRTIVGRKVKTLRKEGQLPATIYGKAIKSQNISVIAKDFQSVYEKSGETGLIELTIDNAVHPVLTHAVQRDPVTDAFLHIEFRQVDLKEKVRARVPVESVGICPVVAQKLGVLLTVLKEIEVEALPTKLPEKIVVDISTLTEVDQELKVSSLAIHDDVAIITDKNLTVIKVGPLVTKEAEAQAKAEEAAAAEAAAAAAGTAGEEKPGEEKTQVPEEVKPTEEKGATTEQKQENNPPEAKKSP
jgi:large subunit ribosomal protein L25